MAKMQKIVSNLWFDTQAEEAAKYYTSIFKNSKIRRITYYGKEGFEIHNKPEGSVLTVEFEIEDQIFTALNGSPAFKFNEAISFIVNCENQKEIDYYWDRLAAEGDPAAQQCGWLKDKYGLSWQVVPTELDEMLEGPPTERSERVMKALLQMQKIDLEKLKQAHSS